MRISLIILFFLTVFSIQAAEVGCNFTSEIQVTKDGQWLITGTNTEDVKKIFGDRFTLSVEDAQLSGLEETAPFLVAKTDKGDLYLRDSFINIYGKMISVDKDVITIYNGLCEISYDS